MTTETKSPEIVVPATTEKSVPKIAPLGEKATLKEVIAAVNALIEASQVKRDRGPDSTRVMVEADASRILLGDLKDVSHTKAAEALGLSYGQVYSARKGFTFKAIYKESLKK